jgi:hypothetical protein
MKHWFDAAAVTLFAGATGVVALHSRGWFATESHDVAPTTTEESYAERVTAALPHLERHVASGSMRVRGLPCDESDALAEIARLETAVGPGDAGNHEAVSVPLATGIAALRQCVACTPEPHGCAAAARAFTVVEERLSLARGASGI